MIEQGIYFALGCIITALAAIGFTPLLWRRAMRLTRRRLELQVPLSMQEILAERDQLRAEFAIERLRYERTIDDVRADKGRDMAELGRRTTQAVTFADQVNALRRLEQSQDKEMQTLLREIAELGAEAGTVKVALHDSHALVDRLKRRLEAAEDECLHHRGELATQRATIATLESRLADLEARRGGREEGVGGWIKAAVAQVTGQAAGQATSQGADGDGEPLRLELEAARAQMRELAGELEAIRERDKAANLRQGLQARTERAAEREGASGRIDPMDVLRAENAALRHALEATRREDGASSAADAGLRDSIHALGLAVAAMTREGMTREGMTREGMTRDGNTREGATRDAGGREGAGRRAGASDADALASLAQTEKPVGAN